MCSGEVVADPFGLMASDFKGTWRSCFCKQSEYGIYGLIQAPLHAGDLEDGDDQHGLSVNS